MRGYWEGVWTTLGIQAGLLTCVALFGLVWARSSPTLETYQQRTVTEVILGVDGYVMWDDHGRRWELTHDTRLRVGDRFTAVEVTTLLGEPWWKVRP